MSSINENHELVLLGDSEMAVRIRAFDWAQTPIGPIHAWPPRLLGALNTCLSSRFQFVIYWGPELICLYNDAEIPTLGDWHPTALGQPASTLLATMWDVVGPQLESVMAGGGPTWAEDERLLFDRSDQLEEAFFTYSYSPIRNESGRVEGVLLSTHETTRRVIGERHLRTMQAVAAQAAAATSAESVCVNATQALVSNPDIPFAQVYLSDGHGFRLRGSAGLAAPGFGSGSQESGWPLQAVVNGGLPEIIDVPEFDGDLPRLAVAAPIIDAGHRLSTGVLVAGIADVRPIDDRQLGFLDLVAGQIGAALTARRALALASATAERELIERNLHDSVQQQWIAARMLIGLVRDSVKTNPDKAIGLLDDVVRELETALEQMREIVQGIPPSLLKTEGLVAAVEEVCRRAPIDAYLHAEGIGRLPDAVETAVYYVCLEALQNVAKHGGPGASADVHFLQDGGAFRIRITDTGAGFDEDDRPSGRGLQNMHARIEALGGSLEVRSSRDRGTTLSASVPLP